MRQSKQIADTIVEFLKSNNVRYISEKDMQDIADLKRKEILKMDSVIDILEFGKFITFDKDFLLWRNNYYTDN